MRFYILIIIILLAGCSAVRIDVQNIDNIADVVLSKNNDLYNRVGRGYKYYVPRGTIYADTTDFNEKLYSNGYYYFLYVDVVSYYNQVEIKYDEQSEAYYSRFIDINDKQGYLEINKVNGLFFVEFMYNYAKIEAMVNYDDINDIVLNASYILSSIKFNNDVIKILLADDYLSLVEEVYDVFQPKRETRNFLRVEYD